jgi:hypothetical protein
MVAVATLGMVELPVDAVSTTGTVVTQSVPWIRSVSPPARVDPAVDDDTYVSVEPATVLAFRRRASVVEEAVPVFHPDEWSED